jgi:ribosomal protein S3
LKEDKGRLSFSKQAIEGFVRSKIEGVGFVDSPQVKVRATKNKIKVKVKGNLNRTSAHIGKTGTLMEDIQKELQEILGSREQVKVDVAYTSFEEHQTTENQSRVK